MKISILLISLFVATAFTAHFTGQSGWRWCNKCQGLFFPNNGSNGVCPDGGAHNWNGSGNYTIYFSPSCGGQNQWYWCNKCEGMFYNGHSSKGKCPAGGSHNTPNSIKTSYAIVQNQKSSCGAQNGWRWCRNCEGLFFSKNATMGSCPDGGTHIAQGSGDYYLQN